MNESVFGAGLDVLWLGVFSLIVVFLICALVSINRSTLDGVTKLLWAVVSLIFPIAGPVTWFIYKGNNRAKLLSNTRA